MGYPGGHGNVGGTGGVMAEGIHPVNYLASLSFFLSFFFFFFFFLGVGGWWVSFCCRCRVWGEGKWGWVSGALVFLILKNN